MRILAACALVVGALLTLTARASACGFAGSLPHTIDPAQQVVDRSPPTLAPLQLSYLSRGADYSDGCSGNSCDGIGTAGIAVVATDDMSPARAIGFRVSIVAGTSLRDLIPQTDEPARPFNPNEILLVWNDGSPDDQGSLDFTVQVVALDAAGNESAPQTLRIQQAKEGGCRVAGASSGPLDPLAMAGMALLCLTAARRRRRRG
jgi:hypothetical protein